MSLAAADLQMPNRIEMLRDIYRIIDEYKRIGIKGINGKLKEAETAHTGAQVYVIEAAAEVYGTTPRRILKTRLRGANGTITLARVSCIILLNKHLGMTPSEIKKVMDRDLSLIAQRINTYNSAPEDDKIYRDKIFKTNFAILETKIQTYLTNG